MFRAKNVLGVINALTARNVFNAIVAILAKHVKTAIYVFGAIAAFHVMIVENARAAMSAEDALDALYVQIAGIAKI